jgi:hypothetical protein
MKEEVVNRIGKQELIKTVQELIQIHSVNPPADYSQISSCLRDKLIELGRSEK